jgi:hypothetical protein
MAYVIESDGGGFIPNQETRDQGFWFAAWFEDAAAWETKSEAEAALERYKNQAPGVYYDCYVIEGEL